MYICIGETYFFILRVGDYPQDEDSMYFCSTGTHLTCFIMSEPRDNNVKYYCHEDLKS
jgi:hypothetical protein